MASVPSTISQDINFMLHPICFDHLKFLEGEKQTEFSYGEPKTREIDERNYDTDRVRRNINEVKWPSETDYEDKILRDKQYFEILKRCPMRPVIIYAEEKKGGWRQEGWHVTQDLAEGAVCVDDNARAALAYLYDYLFETSTQWKDSLECSFHVLTWLGYMITDKGSMYNFAWLSPEFFTKHPDPRQRQNGHLMVDKNEKVEKFDDTILKKIIDGKEVEVPAQLYRAHNVFSIYMNDLPFDYLKPYCDLDGSMKTKKISLRKTNSTRKGFRLHQARTIWAFAIAARAISKKKKLGSDPNEDPKKLEMFSRFIDYYLVLLIKYALEQKEEILKGDSKLQSVVVIGLVEYMLNYKKFKRDSAETATFRSEELRAFMDQLLDGIRAELVRVPETVHNEGDLVGIFMRKTENNSGNNPAQLRKWTDWGQLQIYALSRAFRFQIKHCNNLSEWDTTFRAYQLLDDASFAAKYFYGSTAFNFNHDDPAKQKKRVTKIVETDKGFSRKQGSQVAYVQSSMVLGLYELARAWRKSKRSQSDTKSAENLRYMKRVSAWFIGHNVTGEPVYQGLKKEDGAYRGQKETAPKYDGTGSTADAIDGIEEGNPRLSGNHGAESTIESLIALIFTKHAISKCKISEALE